jgi:hypothetical protein
MRLRGKLPDYYLWYPLDFPPLNIYFFISAGVSASLFAIDFRPGLNWVVRVGLTAPTGIAHVVPNLTAPSIFPALHNI